MASGSEDEFDEFNEERTSENFIDGVYIPPPPPPPKFTGDGTGERLVITYIENENFKSYASRQYLGPFHKSFSSVVGPNGSGKSNVIDSMLFVFGYRAQKLRSKKLSVLIHKSDRFPDLDFCRVTVHFALIDDKGGDDYNLVEGSQFRVSRTAHKDNSSYYAVNDRRMQFKEVAKILSGHGIDLRYNRFLILQGEVEQISLMKPKAEGEDDAGFLEFLEDIIGSNRLKKPIEQLQAKVQEANEMRVEKFNRFRVIQAEKDTLEEAKNEAVNFLQMENEHSKHQHELFQLFHSQSSEKCEEARKEFHMFEEQFTKANEKVVNVQKEKEEREKDLEAFRKNHQAICSAAEQAYEAFKGIERKDIDVRAKVKNAKAKGKKLVEDIELEKEKLEILKNEPEKLEAERKIQEEKKVNFEKRLVEEEERLTVAMNSIQGDTKSLQQEKDRKESELLEFQKAVNDDEGLMNVASSELDLLKNKETKERSQLESLKSKVENAKKDLETKKEQINFNKISIPEHKEKLENVDKQISINQTTLNELQEKNFGLVAKLEDLRSSNSAQASRNKIVNFLMQKKKSGELEGIYGRLGDLGGIDKKYDCAISTACGQLDFIVVDTIDSAQRCVEELKRNNVGSTTFIALEKMDVYKKFCRPLANSAPENVHRLFDLVQVKDDEIRPAFYFALRDTLVADDLDQATRIAFGKAARDKKRWRVVTLDGKLVDPSGAMTAGGRPSRGRMGTTALAVEGNDNEIHAIDDQVRENNSRIEQLRNKIESQRSEKKRLEMDLNLLNRNVEKFAKDLEIISAELKCNQEQIVSQEQLVKSLAPSSKLKEMEKKVETLRAAYEKSKAKASKVEIIVKELDGKIQSIIEKKIGSVKNTIETLKKDLASTNNILLKNSVAEKTNSRNLEKCETKIKNLDAEIDKCHENISELKLSMKSMENEAKEITKKYEELSQEKEQAEEELKSRQQAIGKLKSEENKLNMTNVDMKFELDKLKAVLKEKEAEVQGWVTKMEKLTLHTMEELSQSEFRILTPEELAEINPNYLSKQIQNIENDLKNIKPNMDAIEQYKKVEAIFIERAKELNEITDIRDRRKVNYEKLKAQRLEEFKAGFVTISRKLKEMYRMITMGGDAELEWQDSLDPFSEGINFTVRPNRKSWKAITNLSGGEKTLSSLSLIFALHYFKPSPLYVMDEIDAALDFRNVSIVANYIKERTKNTQFIIISLRNNMYELANKLIGIYKVHNCTKSVAFDPTGIDEPDIVKDYNKKYTKTKSQMT